MNTFNFYNPTKIFFGENAVLYRDGSYVKITKEDVKNILLSAL